MFNRSLHDKRLPRTWAPSLFLLVHIAGLQAAAGGQILSSAQPFPSRDVSLLDGPFKHAQDLQEKSLLRYEPDRFLASFRKEAGLEPKAEVYGGWESMMIAGHSLGHYLSGCSLLYQATGKEVFKQRVDYIVGELALCQEAYGDGYVGAIPNAREIFEPISRGEISVIPKPEEAEWAYERFYLNGSWVPLYSLHKLYAGLRDAYRLCDNVQALEVERKFGDWIGEVVKDLSEAQMQKIPYCEHGGVTGTEFHLELSCWTN